MIEPTKRQLEILAFIKQYIDGYRHAPVYQEVADAFGFKSKNAADRHVQALTKKGLIDRTPFCPRTMKLTDAGLEALKSFDNADTMNGLPLRP